MRRLVETPQQRRAAADAWWRERQQRSREWLRLHEHPLNKRDKVPPNPILKSYAYHWARVKDELHVIDHQDRLQRERLETWCDVIRFFSFVFGEQSCRNCRSRNRSRT
jgi:hypothetical protein